MDETCRSGPGPGVFDRRGARLGASRHPGPRARPQAKADPAAAPVQNFYDGLVASMKAGGTVKSRYDKLKPVVEQSFDLPGMTALSVGTGWSSMSAADQKALTDAFERMTIA